MKKKMAVFAVSITAAALLTGTGVTFGMDRQPAGWIQNFKGQGLKSAVGQESSVNTKFLWEKLTETENEAILLGWVGKTQDWRKKYTDQELAAIRSAYTPNTVEAGTSIPAKGVSEIALYTNLCGIRIVPVETDNISLSYLGVKDKTDFTVQTEMSKDGVLSVRVEGKLDTPHYISQTPGNLVNLIQIEAPTALVKKMTIQDNTSNILVQGGPAAVSGKTVSGTVIVKGDSLDSTYQMESVNGTIAIVGKEVTGKVTLKTVNGECMLRGDTVTGEVFQECVNGDVMLTAGKVETATLKCINGDIMASIGAITKQVEASTINGDILVELLEKPEDFSFVPKAAWLTDLNVPDGWSKGYTVGTGNAKLTVSSTNGGVIVRAAGQ